MADHTRGEPGYGPNRVEPHIVGAIDLGLTTHHSWMRQAACRHSDAHPDIFHPQPKARTEHQLAKHICRQCPVQQRCLDHAIGEHETDGIWGGMTPGERHRHAYRARKEATA